MKYMTLEKFKELYIRPLYSKEKGLNNLDISDFKKDNKIKFTTTKKIVN
jgi:hypothetical protein